MQDYEKLGVFYLGRRYDVAQRVAQPELLLYDSKDLLTHAVCVGMTGSGKTGLCLGLIEEAAMDGIPSILIDPKGDLANLMLTFPDLAAPDFEPWVNADEARNRGITVAQYAEEEAAKWRKGLADWDQDGDRIRRLRAAADFAIYTPASTSGRAVSVLRSFAAPPVALLDDREALRERVSATASSLLSLAGVDATDPLKSREHILLSTILDGAWRAGKDLDLPAIIQQIQSPPFSKIGVLGLESFYSSKDRFELAMQINTLLASPGFEAWMEGDPFDIDRFLYTETGKPRVAIFSIAHLGESERMFFVSLLLNQLVAWVRTRSGTTSLRALFYMDEIFGYFPPVANPPSKAPLLTLLKQARAFGVGVVLATQNPVDLDYKGLANTGTWFVGRLQTERDKARLLDGLEGAASNTGLNFDRAAMEKLISQLGSRVFLINNVHGDAPDVFQSRWTMSYLRGPLARTEIRRLAQAAPVPAHEPAKPVSPVPAPSTSAASAARPLLPPEVVQHFVPPAHPSGSVAYRPMLLGAAQVHFLDARAKIDTAREVLVVTPITNDAVPVNWDNALALDMSVMDLEKDARDGAAFAEPPAAASRPRNYTAWSKDFTNWVFRTEKLTLLKSSTGGIVSRPHESERDFRIRLQQSLREKRDEQVEALRRKYASKFRTLEDRLRRAEQAQEREEQQSRAQQMNTAITVGSTLLGAMFGRRSISTAMRSATRSYQEKQDVERAAETVMAVRQQLDELNFQLELEISKIHSSAASEPLEAVEIRPKKTNIEVKLVCLAWVAEDLIARE